MRLEVDGLFRRFEGRRKVEKLKLELGDDDGRMRAERDDWPNMGGRVGTVRANTVLDDVGRRRRARGAIRGILARQSRA